MVILFIDTHELLPIGCLNGSLFTQTCLFMTLVTEYFILNVELLSRMLILHAKYAF